MLRVPLQLSLRATLVIVALLALPLAYLDYRQRQHFVQYRQFSEQKFQSAAKSRERAEWLRQYGGEQQYRYEFRRLRTTPMKLAEQAARRAESFDIEASMYRDAARQWFWEPHPPGIPIPPKVAAPTVSLPSPPPAISRSGT